VSSSTDGTAANSRAAERLDADVVVVGYGPVGQTAAVLLAQHGWRVTVVERHSSAYARPRAVSFDDEVGRLLAFAGIADGLRHISQPGSDYVWRNAAGETLLHFEYTGAGPSGWPVTSSFHQPALEELLDRRARSVPGLTVLRGLSAVSLADDDGVVTLTTEQPDGTRNELRSHWLIGCDGANSFVRDALGVASEDLGFCYDWLIVDVVLDEPRDFSPTNLQICDPARPVTMVSGGPGHRRWEFMRLPTETLDELNDLDTAWRLLAPFDVTPRNASIVRHAAYTFQARWARRWRAGRVFLAGDAAHLMPPFAGQGLCSGIRDAANLAWKLDLVLCGVASARLLDTYEVERSGHVRRAIDLSVELGKIICLADPAEAAVRDAYMSSLHVDPTKLLGAVPPPRLTGGLLHRGQGGSPAGPAGLLMPQGRVRRGEQTGLLDDVLGRGFMVLCTEGLGATLTDERRRLLDAVGGQLVELVPADRSAAGIVVDVDGTHLRALADLGAVAVVVRPDGHIFGAAAQPSDLDGLLGDLAEQLNGAIAP